MNQTPRLPKGQSTTPVTKYTKHWWGQLIHHRDGHLADGEEEPKEKKGKKEEIWEGVGT
jgi:hypothetical protein